MLAPVVALVPTSDIGKCWSFEPTPPTTIEYPPGEDPVKEWFLAGIDANIENNVEALLVAGAVGLAAAALIALIAFRIGKARGEHRSLADVWKGEARATVRGLLVAALLLGATALYFFGKRDSFYNNAHGIAAGSMFGMLALAAVINSWECHKYNRRGYFKVYGIIAAVMVAAVPLLFSNWEHRTLVVEAIEILAFATFWLVLTRELWHDTVRSAAVVGKPEPAAR